MGQYITLEDERTRFDPVPDYDGTPLVDGKFFECMEIFSVVAKHSSKFHEFGDGDKRVRPETEEEFKSLRQAIVQSEEIKVNKELALMICDQLQKNPTYYLTPSY